MQNLNGSPLGQVARIVSVQRHSQYADLDQRLHHRGFIAGEVVCVLHRYQPGNDPLIVRVGTATFALRQFEADCVWVEY